MKRLILLLACSLMVGAIDAQQPTTRGIGIYPGDPAQFDGPRIEAVQGQRRNLSLNRITTASSQYDNNLTAQLATDGILAHRTPLYIEVSTPAGAVPRRELEWSLDECPYTHNVLPGSDSYLRYDLQGWTVTPDRVVLEGQVAYDETKYQAGDDCTIALETSADGEHWTQLATYSQTELIGEPSSARLHDDPDKRLGQGPLPTRNISRLELPIARPQASSHLRLHVRMNGASHWAFSQVNFYEGDKLIDMKPAQFFESAWMSAKCAGRSSDWVMVDLGASANISDVKLHWIARAVKGEVQVSDNAQRWRTVARLTNKDSEEIPCNARGRYVRLLLQKPLAQHYVLSEMEVWGQGGVCVVPQPARAAKGDTLLLSRGNWRIHRPRVGERIEDMLKSDYPDQTETWLPATVPGTALVSYMNAGAVPNTNYAQQGVHISESYFRSNFWYRCHFSVPTDFRRQRMYLNLDGINWKARVWLNGHYLGLTEGAFIRTAYDVTEYLLPEDNVLAVECICNAHFGAAKEKNAMNTAINGGILGADNPTFHATVGWDWINSTRGREVGIWNDVYLTHSSQGVRLSDPFVDVKLNLPDTTLAQLRPQVVVVNDNPSATRQRIIGRIGEVQFAKDVTLQPNERRIVTFEPEEFPQLKFERPRLWWPNGYGTPYLYDASFRLSSAEDVQVNYHVGIRQVTWDTASDRLTLYVNGRRVVGKGGNWGFSEHNLLYRQREYDAAVRYHKEMNFTMIRNWVGQTLDEEFYEACDRYGIMVWQDFWLANPCDGPDPDDETMFARNAEDMVGRIRRHPCLALYCGRNEGYPPAMLNTALRRIVLDLHPGLPYIPSSADDVVSGHGPYWAVTPREYFSLKAGADKFHSERGMPNVMNIESLRRALAPESLWPQGHAWGEHDFTLEGAQRGASFNQMLCDMFGESRSAEEFCQRAQWINYEGYRALFESRSKYRRGLLLWMTHPAWPSMVWQTYDYYFQPTAAYFGSRKGCEPLHIQWNAATDSVEVVCYAQGQDELTARATLYNMAGKALWSEQRRLQIAFDETKPLLALPEEKSGALLRLELLDKEGGVVSHNDYVIGTKELPTHSRLPRLKASLTYTEEPSAHGERFFTIRLHNPHRQCALMQRVVLRNADGEEVLPVLYSDNYVHLLPGEEREIRVTCKTIDSTNKITPSL